MEIQGNINDITIKHHELSQKIKIRTISVNNKRIVDEIELVIGNDGKIVMMR